MLKRAIDSVLVQEYQHRSIFIVDDGSTDGTGAYLDELAAGRADIRVFHNELTRGVNFSRNRAIRQLPDDSWALLLDDDDVLLPGGLAVAADRLSRADSSLQVAFFNTKITTADGTFAGGYQFPSGADPEYAAVSYEGLMTKEGMRGDAKPAIRSSLFARGEMFAEDVNGFESEFYFKLLRDGIGMHFYRDEIMRVDQAHGAERLSDTAGVRDPESFVRVHRRILHDHADFFGAHPLVLRQRALSGLKLAVRAKDWRTSLLFCRTWLTSFFFGQKKQDKAQTDVEEIGDQPSK